MKLKLLSATRWVERHTAIFDFIITIHEAVIYCLEVISGQPPPPSADYQLEAGISNSEELSKFDAKSVTEGNGLLRALASDSFIVALQCNAFASRYLKGLSVLLQGSHLDIIKAYSQIANVVDLLRSHWQNAEETFHGIYEVITTMISVHGREDASIPRVTARQTQRSNVDSSSPEEYWRISVYIPFLESLLSELGNRYSSLSQKSHPSPPPTPLQFAQAISRECSTHTDCIRIRLA